MANDKIKPVVPKKACLFIVLGAISIAVYDGLYLLPGFVHFILLLILAASVFSIILIGVLVSLSELFLKMRNPDWPASRALLGWGNITILLAGLALIALIVQTNAVLRTAFFLARPRLQEIAAMDDPSKVEGSYLVFWFLEGVSRDNSGGVYFKLAEAMDFIDDDFVGYAYQPNHTGSPWGRAKYRIIPINDDWHIFYANNDY